MPRATDEEWERTYRAKAEEDARINRKIAEEDRQTKIVWSIIAVIALPFVAGLVWLAVTLLHWLWTHPLF
ncbi:MAG: hypothetical protein WBD94_04995 [Candidatus Acidiferrales bacterium]